MRSAWALLAPTVATAQPAADTLEPVVITGTRTERRAFDLPMSIDAISRSQIQDGKARVNISEDLNRVPGTFVQNRENFAQELQITIRGFGARSQFGTRGIKLIADGIPASTPDGQGSPGRVRSRLGGSDRSAARTVFGALWQPLRRRRAGVQRERDFAAHARRRISRSEATGSSATASRAAPSAAHSTAWRAPRISVSMATASTVPRARRSSTRSLPTN